MKYILPIIYLCVPIIGVAQEQQDTLNEAVPLKTTVISASRSVQSITAAAQTVAVINTKQIERANAQSTADLLQQSGKVFVQKSQQGGGSPVLRGFEASRVLLVMDKVRMNNAIYRAGHLQNAITMDNAALDRVEVLFGPASTMYGTDALGGAVCFYTKTPSLGTEDDPFATSANAMVRYGTVNQEKTAHLDFNLGNPSIASFTSLTYSDFSDLKMGKNNGFGPFFGLRPFYVERMDGNDSIIANDNPYLQKYSGYQQVDLLEKILYQPNTQTRHLLNVQYSNSSNIPRYDRLTELSGGKLRFAEWYYGPQKRFMGAYTMSHKGENRQIETTISYQDIDESRHNRNFNSNWLRNRIENVKVLGLIADYETRRGAHTFRTGLDVQYNIVTSTAFSKHVETDATEPLDTRYPDGGSSMTNMALFGSHNWRIGDKLLFSEGLRIGYAIVQASFEDKTFFDFPFSEAKQTSPVYSGSASAIYLPNENWKLAMNAATGFRVPNVDDLGRVFESVTGQSIIVPNPDIKPEKTYNLDLVITRTIPGILRWENVIWATALRDAIILGPSPFNGRDSIEYGGATVGILSNQNNRKARVWGFSSHLEADVYDNLAVYASFNQTTGTILNKDKNTPLDHIPPRYGNAGLRFHNRAFFAEGFAQYNGAKPLSLYAINGEDNAQYATRDGAVKWTTIHLRAGYTFPKYLHIQAGIDNLFDTQYRVFASGINGAGRNFYITLRVKGF